LVFEEISHVCALLLSSWCAHMMLRLLLLLFHVNSLSGHNLTLQKHVEEKKISTLRRRNRNNHQDAYRFLKIKIRDCFPQYFSDFSNHAPN